MTNERCLIQVKFAAIIVDNICLQESLVWFEQREVSVYKRLSFPFEVSYAPAVAKGLIMQWFDQAAIRRDFDHAISFDRAVDSLRALIWYRHTARVTHIAQ